jgi:hypothetical protein
MTSDQPIKQLLIKIPTATAKQEFPNHEEVSRPFLYASLAQHQQAGSHIAYSEKEFDRIQRQTDPINATANTHKTREEKISELKNTVHHVREKEGQIFGNEKKIITEASAYLLREKMHEFEAKVLSELL